MENKFSLERVVPDQMNDEDAFDRASLKLHRDRYDFAIEHGVPGRILDIACGAGYGSHQMLLNDKFANSRITGVDISPDAVEYARNRYAHQRLEFICSDAMHFADENYFDTIVSLETIEHVEDPVAFINKMHMLLNTGGLLIVSAPVTPSTDGNPYHRTDFTPSEFRRLFDPEHFTIESSLVQEQPFSLGLIFRTDNKRLANTRNNLGHYYIKHPKIFFRRIRSLIVDGLKNKYLTLALKKI